MNLLSKRNIKSLLKKYNLQPSKGLGQNFLVDKTAIKKIIKAAELSPSDTVLEIGPGLGSLTAELAKSAKKVIAVEKDEKMSEVLKKTLKEFNNIQIIKKDILKITNIQYLISNKISNAGTKKIGNWKLEIGNYKVVANLPFYITSPVIRKFLESPGRPKIMVLTVQKEVGQRICARPPKMNLLAISVQFYAEPKIVSYIPKKSFWPEPKVDSAIIGIKETGAEKKANQENFFRVVKAGFSHPRKQLLTNLSEGLKLNKEKTKLYLLRKNIQPGQRAETLRVKDWLKLTDLPKKN